MELLDRFLVLSFGRHLFMGFLIRTLFIVYGMIQDEILNVPFTDIDYKVFSDAARYVLSGLSPYKRHTYRYSPLIAYLATPNHLLHYCCGKLVFSIVDILTTIVIYKILKAEGVICKYERTCYSLFWLYNPLSIVISCRGNCDSLSGFLVLATIYFFKKKQIVYCGLTHGLSVHLRLYPVIYSLPIYLCLKNPNTASVIGLIYPTLNRIKLVVSFFLSFTMLFILFYRLYGDDFVNESYLFHFKRVDIRHNYSVFFYYQYLSFEWGTAFLGKVAMTSPLLVLLLSFSLYYSCEKDLCFCILLMSFAFVTYNRVLTCQYFVWFLCLLPVCLARIQCPPAQSSILAAVWLLAQLTWLLPAYLLEFKFKNTFHLVWLQTAVFFLSNIMVLSALIRGYSAKMKSY